MADLKSIYKAPNEESVCSNLENFADKWDALYTSYVRSWKENWDLIKNELSILRDNSSN